MSNPSFVKRTDQGLCVRVRLTPSGRQNGIDGVMKDMDGETVLKATATTAPENGKANKALIKLLAKEWKLAKSSVDVVQGQTSRNKVLMVLGNAADLHQTIGAWATEKGLA
ncbi:MAG: DUF167 family protein [Magnetovibrio sp.]|nr:DUF167 family protein [Magnetovibrio sp.]